MKQISLITLAFWLVLPNVGAAQNSNAAQPQTAIKNPTSKPLAQKPLTQKQKRQLQAEVLDTFFGRLHFEKNPAKARLITRAIWKTWAKSGSDTADLLLRRSQKAMAAGRTHVSISILSLVIEQHPQFAEAWNKRATAHFMVQDYRKSKDDIQEVLKLEPRHFGALSGLGMIYQAEGKHKKALQVFRRALAINPHLKNVRKTIKVLSGRIEKDI